MDMDFGDTQILTISVAAAPKVLIVDDDELARLHLQGLIAQAGFSATAVADGEAALAALSKNFTPIVITDKNMPGMDGLELCRQLRQQTYPGYIYVLLLTVDDAEQDILAGLDAGADDYLSKRTSSAQLIARLRTAQRILGLEQSLKQALNERRMMAMTDALTGTYNRRYFTRTLTRELRLAERAGTSLALLLMDIDHFKKINDRHGHAAGDQILRHLVKRLGENLPRATDWCARLGGEEFAVVLPQTSLEGAAQVAEKLRKVIAATPFQTDTGNLPVSVSIGISSVETLHERATASVDQILEQADQQLYLSKDHGRNRVSVPPRTNPIEPHATQSRPPTNERHKQ
jgi:two-component system cell cycle response regulator